MKREFIITSTFDKRWKELNLTDESLRLLQEYLLKNPKVGDIIEGTGGLRKLRWRLADSGKRGGIRVQYVDFLMYEKSILVNCYSKNEKDDISEKEKNVYHTLIKEIERWL